jgi:3-oxoacyl-[acyl-carrier protein] reductase
VDLGLQGKVALVAAASRGLGLAVAEELAAEGCKLVICARGEEALAEACASLAAAGAEVAAVPADVSRAIDVDAVVAAAHEAFGPVDVLVTNSGGPPAGPFEAHSRQVWSEAVLGTLDSVLNFSRAVLPGMRSNGWGRIINITSIAVKQPVDGLILSNSIRAAVTGFARTLANEVAASGVTVNNVMPGFTWTDRVEELARHQAETAGGSREEIVAAWEAAIPMGRLAQPSEFAAMVAFLASERASYITGASIAVDGGWIRGLL